MARIRTIKPEFFRHESLFEAEQHYQMPLRLIFAGLFTCCDREGRFRWRPRQLKLDILPYDHVDFSHVLDALATRGFVVKYQVGGEFYGYIPSWHRHQHINNKEPASTLPSPEESHVFIHANAEQTAQNLDKNCTFITRDSRVNDALITPNPPDFKSLNNSQGEEEMEGNRNGKEKILSIEKSILKIFQFWQTTLNHPQAKLDEKRKQCIRLALTSGYTIEQLCTAIQGCSLTPHNMGENDRGERYDGLHVIFKNADNIERFIQNYYNPPTKKINPKSNSISTNNRRLSDENFENKQYNQTPLQDIAWINKK